MGKHAPEHVAELELVLRDISSIIRRHGREILTNYPITSPQFAALVALQNLGTPTMSQLCDHLALASSTVTDLVDRMERNGMVERIRDTEDRRVIRLKVTQLGFDVVDAVIEHRREYLATVLGHLEPGITHELRQTLKALHEAMMIEEPQPRPDDQQK